MKKIVFAFLACFLCAQNAVAQDIVNVTAYGHTHNNNLEVLLRFNIRPGWHIFAPYIQTFGTPLKVTWKLPEKTTVAKEKFGRTQHFNQGGLAFDGYENSAFYKATLQNAGKYEYVTADISWQACADECIPERVSLKIPFENTPGFAQAAKIAQPTFEDGLAAVEWLFILFAAFGGGLILNLMPCVFPILSLKIMSLAQVQTHTRRQEALFYTIGVVASMTAVAVILLVLRRFDASTGWGFQLQSPWFVGIMLAVFIWLTLLMSDVVRFGGGFLNRLAGLKFCGPRFNAFMTGLLAVLVASPCTAPFMGAAVGYALMMPVYAGFPVFWALGVGYALPFALLALYPQASGKIMPKPGIWMVRLKRILSIPLILTCLWLAWILSAQITVFHQEQNFDWKPYSMAQVEQALEQRRPVFIDFTAKWCMTCLVNKKTSLQSETMAALAQRQNILLLRADITSHDPESAAALASYGRAGVPLYVYYNGKGDDYVILPQILTPGILQEYLR